VNSHIIALAIVLGANSDTQPVLTAKGVADYVAKYITKYGAGMSVHAKIASLLDDIIVKRAGDGSTMTVASLLSKAFIATAVPETLSALEAWHILWQLPRTVRSRFFKGLNMDGLTGVKMPKEVAKENEDVGLDGDAAQRKKQFNKTTPIERYSFRLKCRCKDPVLAAELPRMSLLRFTSEINFNDTGICRMHRP